jgi:tetratricopeptide (TPR) repeat protein
MEPGDVEALVRAKMEQLAGGGTEVSAALVTLVAARSEGNPFYVEELLNFIVSQGIDASDPSAVEAVRLPESLHTLVLSRIDAAAEGPRRTMKVASVIGRVFTVPMLPDTYEELGDVEVVAGNLRDLRILDLVALDREADQAWMFKNVVTQEVAYESLPFALRAVLHGRVGAVIEQAAGDDLERVVPLLEHHYWRSDREAKKREFLRRAAEAAQASYANQAAIVYYKRLIPLLAGTDRVDGTIQLAQVLHVIGDIPRAEDLVGEARALAVELDDTGRVARCDHLLGESARRVGRFGGAIALLERANEGFSAAGDEAGVADVLQVMGTVNAQRGNAEVARERYEASLAIRERLGDEAGVAAITNNLGIVAQQQGDVVRARELGERALRLYTRLGDRRRIGSCEVNLAWMDGMAGDHASARRHCEEAIRLAIEVGDRLNLAIAQNNLGDALRELGLYDDAGRAYATAVEIYRDLNDRGPLMALLEDVAVLAARRSRPVVAFQLRGAADALRAELGSPRTAAAEETLAEQLAQSLATLGNDAATAAHRDGMTLGGGAIDLAIASARGAP